MKSLTVAILTAAPEENVRLRQCCRSRNDRRRHAGRPQRRDRYVFDSDKASSGKSACNRPCVSNWPPLMVAETDRPMGACMIVTRNDGKKQWAINGKLPSVWFKDGKPGDKTGDGFTNVWQVAKPWRPC